MIGLKNTFSDTRKSYEFHLAFKAVYAAEQTQEFINQIYYKLPESVTNTLESLKCNKSAAISI